MTGQPTPQRTIVRNKGNKKALSRETNGSYTP